MKKNSISALKTRRFNPPRTEQYSKNADPQEEKEARKALEHFVTDPQGSIYAINPVVPELFSALLKARYSRTELTARQLLWREFVSRKENIPWKVIQKGLSALEEVFDFQRAEGVAERILLQYGDDSVFELGGAHLFLDRVSMIASKVLEDARIGISPLEKSTRYVVFDQKDQFGDYPFFKDPKLMESKYRKLYLDTTRSCFELYTQSVEKLMDHFRKEMPIEKEKFPDFTLGNALMPFKKLEDERSIKAAQTAYKFSVKAKACDVARVLLPASTLTNIGEFGNARAFGYLFTKMLTSDLAEMQMIGEEAVRELKKILPKFFDIVDNKYGKEYQEYLRKTEELLSKMARDLLKGEKMDKVERVELVKMDKDPEVNIVAALLYPYAQLPLQQLVRIASKLGEKKIGDILHASLKFRTNRRHKVPRAYEIAGYELVYDILGNFGIYRDLHRQRVLTQQRQHYTTSHGYDMPEEFKLLGLEKQFEQLMGQMKAAHDKVAKEFLPEAQYLTTMAHYTRWYMGMNLREGFWMTELRSVPQGHFSYRTIAQDMYLKAQKVYPFIKDIKNEQIDMSDRSKNLERMEAMQKIQTKLAAIEDKYK